MNQKLVLGVSGHRRLPDQKIPCILRDVRAFLSDLKLKYEEKALTLLSSLAEGADTLCAKLALDMGLRLVVPLPLRAPEYRKDFTGGAAAEFDCLLSLADEVFVVPAGEPVPARPARGFFYRQAGLYVAKHCDILLAIWDGAEHDTPDGAGTWETVKLAREMGKEVRRVAI